MGALVPRAGLRIGTTCDIFQGPIRLLAKGFAGADDVRPGRHREAPWQPVSLPSVVSGEQQGLPMNQPIKAGLEGG